MLINLYTLLLAGVTLAVVLSRRTMYAILYLILLFVLIAFVVVSWKVDFIGLIFIIVYVGAIATLFLFIIMMLGGEDWTTTSPLNLENSWLLLGSGWSSKTISRFLAKTFWYFKHFAVDLLLALSLGVIAMEIFSNELAGNFSARLSTATTNFVTEFFHTAYLYGIFFYNYRYIPFLLAAVVLLIAMIGSIVLTTRLIAPKI